jgi:hypothetical protein
MSKKKKEELREDQVTEATKGEIREVVEDAAEETQVAKHDLKADETTVEAPKRLEPRRKGKRALRDGHAPPNMEARLDVIEEAIAKLAQRVEVFLELGNELREQNQALSVRLMRMKRRASAPRPATRARKSS